MSLSLSLSLYLSLSLSIYIYIYTYNANYCMHYELSLPGGWLRSTKTPIFGILAAIVRCSRV